MENTAGRSSAALGALEILTRPEFGPVDFFELLETVSESISEYEGLSYYASKIDEYVGSFDLNDRLIRKAVADVALGYCKQAMRLIDGLEGRMADLVRARAYQLMDNQTKAISHYKKSATYSANLTLHERLFLAQCLCFNGKREIAEKAYDSLSSSEKTLYQARYLKALISEFDGDTDKTLRNYTDIIDSEDHPIEAIFRKAFILDTRGDDMNIVEELYRRLITKDRFHQGAAINLALLYIDQNRFSEAEGLLNNVLTYDPDNDRVWLYLRDAQASNHMMYDEGRYKEDEKLRQILRLPISEFELSVRSRNCLARMNVHTLGDLISKSEPELLAYKNFGETSLKEIKEILGRKGLRLGMNREEVERKMRSPSQRLAALTVTDNILEQPVSALSLSVRSQRCLEAAEIKTVLELTEHSERMLLSSKNFGLTSLTEVKKKLASYGLSLLEE